MHYWVIKKKKTRWLCYYFIENDMDKFIWLWNNVSITFEWYSV